MGDGNGWTAFAVFVGGLLAAPVVILLYFQWINLVFGEVLGLSECL
jgi:hypothetical protein